MLRYASPREAKNAVYMSVVVSDASIVGGSGRHYSWRLKSRLKGIPLVGHEVRLRGLPRGGAALA